MNKLKISTIALSVFLLISCNNKSKEETKVAAEIETQQHAEKEDIQLNNGKKWKVDDNMMLLIRKMEKEIDTTDNENYQPLINNLAHNLDLLTSNCTMKGQAHDELHKWLLPLIESVKTFSKDQSAVHFAQIQNSFITFNNYFE